MASGERFSGYTATLGYATGQTLDLTQLVSINMDMGNTIAPLTPAGLLNPAKHLTPRSIPNLSIVTGDLAGIFAAIDAQTGLLCDETSTFRLQERSDGGAFEAGATHPQWTTAKGFIWPTTLSAELESQEGAQLTLSYMPLWNESVAPLVPSDGNNLSGVTAPAFSSAFFLASPYLNGTVIEGCQSVNIDFGINVVGAPSQPNTYNTHASIQSRQPKITFTVMKADEQATMVQIGTNIATSFAAYLQRADPDSDRIAAATTSHFKFSCTAGRIERRSVSWNGVADAAVEFMVYPNGSIAVSTGVAIGA